LVFPRSGRSALALVVGPGQARDVNLLRRLESLFMAVVLAAGCTTAASPSPSSAAPGGPFELTVAPELSVGRSIGGQRVAFLVDVSGTLTDAPVTIRGEADGATVEVEPQALVPGTIGEVTVIPAAVEAEAPLQVAIIATRGTVERRETRTLNLGPGDDSLADQAAAHLAPFVAWLATERPELGIDEDTAWEGTPGSWVLVVEHYLFFSDEWEVGLSWHVMIPPDDWARIYLRRRFEEMAPGLAFEISSVDGGGEPHEIAPEGIWR
jgi:hypothetical protein